MTTSRRHGREVSTLERPDRPIRPKGPLVEPCVCGGPDIVAVTFLPDDIVYGIRQHQIEPVHIAWDLAHGHPLALWQRVAGGGS